MENELPSMPETCCIDKYGKIINEPGMGGIPPDAGNPAKRHVYAPLDPARIMPKKA